MKKALFSVFAIMLMWRVSAQDIAVVRDFGAWLGVEVEKEISDDFKLECVQQLRMYKNAGSFDDYVFDVGGKYRMNRNFRLGASIRYTYNARRVKKATNDYRYCLDLLYKGNLTSRLRLDYRLRYQHEYVNLFSAHQPANINNSAFRNRIKIRYKAGKKHHLYLSGELWRRQETFSSPRFNRLRFYAGDQLAIAVGELDCSLGYEQDLNTEYPLSFFYLKAIYHLEL